jgi:hypothetical protein
MKRTVSCPVLGYGRLGSLGDAQFSKGVVQSSKYLTIRDLDMQRAPDESQCQPKIWKVIHGVDEIGK